MGGLGRGVLAGVRLACLALVLSAVAFSWRGLDLGDEGYTLSLIAHPDAARPAGDVFLFGFVLHPLWVLCGEDIVRYRLLGWGILFAATLLLVTSVDRAWWGRRREPGDRLTLTLLALAATSLTMSFSVRVLAYRTLVLVGVMFAVAAVALVQERRVGRAGLLLGLAVPTVFVGRPTGAVALLVLVCAWLLVARPPGTARLLAVAGATAALAAVAVLRLADLDLPGVVAYLSGGATMARLSGGFPGLFALLGVRETELRPLLVLGPPLLLTGLMAARRTRSARRGLDHGALLWLTLLLVAGAADAWVVSTVLVDGSRGYLATGVLAALPLASAALAVRRPGRPGGLTPGQWRLWAVLAMAPYVAVVGTNGDVLEGMCYACVFWVVGLVLVVATHAPEPGGHPSAAGLGVALMAVLALALPRYAELIDGPQSIELGRADVPVDTRFGRVSVKPEEAVVLRTIDAARRDQGIDADVPTVDLSGLSYGYAFYLGGRPLGRAGFFSFYPGSADAAAYALARESCLDKARAFVLYAADNPDDLSALWSDGVRLDSDYEVVATFDPDQGIGWRNGLHVQLLRPKPQVAALMGCPAP